MFTQIIAAIAQKFQDNGVPYIIIGGQAVLLYGEPRLTKDIDITLGLNIDAVDRIHSLLVQIPLEPIPNDYHSFVKKTMVLPMIHKESGVRVDIVFSFSLFEQQAIERANIVQIENTSVKFVSIEDLVIFKIFSGRPRDLDDATTVLIKNPNVDVDYIRTKLTELSFEDRNLLSTFENLLLSGAKSPKSKKFL